MISKFNGNLGTLSKHSHTVDKPNIRLLVFIENEYHINVHPLPPAIISSFIGQFDMKLFRWVEITVYKRDFCTKLVLKDQR